MSTGSQQWKIVKKHCFAFETHHHCFSNEIKLMCEIEIIAMFSHIIIVHFYLSHVNAITQMSNKISGGLTYI